MRQGASTILLLVLVLVLGAFIWFVERKSDTTERRQELAKRALAFDPTQVDSLRLASETLQITCRRTGSEWFLTAPNRARADAGAIENLLDHLAHVPRGEVITAQQQHDRQMSRASYGMEPPRIRIVLGEGPRQLTLLIGRDAPVGDQLYVMLEGTEDIMATHTNLLSALPRSAVDLRDRRLLRGAPADVVRIDLRNRDGFLQLTRSEPDSWRIAKPLAGRASPAAVQDLLSQLFSFQVEDYEAASTAAASLYGLDEPSAQITLTTARGDEKTFLLGRAVDGNTNLVYAVRQGEEEVCLVNRSLGSLLAARLDELRDRRLLPLTAFDVKFLRVEQPPSSALTLLWTNASWMVVEPRTFPADGNKVQLLLSEWTGARIEAFREPASTNLADLGLSPPAWRLTFGRQDPAVSEEGQLVVLISSKAPAADRWNVKLTQEDGLYAIAASPVQLLTVHPLDYRDAEVIRLDPESVQSITWRSGDQTLEVQRTPAGPFAVVGSGAPVLPERLADVLAALASLRTPRYVEQDPTQLASYGLDTPSAQLTLGLRGETGFSKILLRGSTAPGGGHFAMIKGMDLVFVLESRTSDLLWSPLLQDRAPPPPAHIPPDLLPTP